MVSERQESRSQSGESKQIQPEATLEQLSITSGDYGGKRRASILPATLGENLANATFQTNRIQLYAFQKVAARTPCGESVKLKASEPRLYSFN